MNKPVGCPVCQRDLVLSPVMSKKSKRHFMLACPKDGRHFRGFINHKPFVDEVIAAASTDD